MVDAFTSGGNDRASAAQLGLDHRNNTAVFREVGSTAAPQLYFELAVVPGWHPADGLGNHDLGGGPPIHECSSSAGLRLAQIARALGGSCADPFGAAHRPALELDREHSPSLHDQPHVAID